jgi:hypothetical protein
LSAALQLLTTAVGYIDNLNCYYIIGEVLSYGKSILMSSFSVKKLENYITCPGGPIPHPHLEATNGFSRVCAGVDEEQSGGSSMHRPGSEDPIGASGNSNLF